MAETTEVIFNVLGVTDVGFGDSTTTFTQFDRLQVNGTTADQSAQYIDSAVIPLSTASKTLLSLTGTKDLDDAFTSLASSVPSVATTSTLGTVRISTAAVVPVALITADPVYGYIPTSAQKDGLTGTPAEYTISGYTAPSTTNGYLTEGQTDAALYGTGRDGVFKTGAVAANSTVSALVEVASAGAIPAGTYNYKVTAGNATGETNVSAASSNIVLAGSTSAVTLTVPVNGDADAAWRKIYRSDNTGAGTYRLIGYIPDNTTTSFRDTKAYGGQAAPSSDTTAATWTVGVAGEFHWDGDVTLPALTLTGDMVIRAKGYVTIGGAITGSGVGNGYSVLRGVTGLNNPGSYNLKVYGPGGFSTNVRAVEMPGAGSSGFTSGGTAGVGGAPGATLIIYAYGIRIGANVTLSGANGSAGLTTDSSGGGGGAGGILACIGREYVTAATVTITTNGGNGGNGIGASGAATAYAGRGAGGGAFIAIAPVVDVSGVTHTKNVGSAGTNAANATTILLPGDGGSCSGDGGGTFAVNASTSPPQFRSPTAGQTITVTSQPFALRI